MSSKFRRCRSVGRIAGSGGCHATIPFTRHQVPGFETSTEESLLSRDIAVARMRQLKLTPLQPLTSREDAFAHPGDMSPAPFRPGTRDRARAGLEPRLADRQSRDSSQLIDALKAYDADSEASDEEPEILDTNVILGNERARCTFSQPPCSRSGSQSRSIRNESTSRKRSSDLSCNASVIFADRLHKNAPPIATRVNSMDRRTSAALYSGLLDEDPPPSKRRGFFSSPHAKNIKCTLELPRRDSVPVEQYNLPRKRVYGVNWFIVEADPTGPEPAPFIKANGWRRCMPFSSDRSDDETYGSVEDYVSPLDGRSQD